MRGVVPCVCRANMQNSVFPRPGTRVIAEHSHKDIQGPGPRSLPGSGNGGHRRPQALYPEFDLLPYHTG